MQLTQHRKTKIFDLQFVNTICYPTKRNHEQIKKIASENDIMLIIGSFTSANSKRLTQLSIDQNPNSYQVTGSDDLDPKWFYEKENITWTVVVSGIIVPYEGSKRTFAGVETGTKEHRK